MIYNAIELAAYLPAAEIHQPVHVLRVPGELREALEKLYRSGLSDEFAAATRTFPIRSLNTLLPLAAPDVLSVGRRVSMTDDVPWLLSLHQVDTGLVRDLIHIWSLGLKGAEQHRAEVERLIDETAFEWKHELFDLAETTMSPGGTAQPADQIYPLLAAWLARKIRLEGDLTAGNGESLAFMESPWRGHGAELVSWPPRQGLPEEPDSWFSYVITVSVQTLPFQPSFRVHVRTGVRRWVTRVGSQGLLYTAGRSVSVYLATATAWPGMSDVRSRLAVHRLRYDVADGRHFWHSIDRPELLPHASLISSPVNAAALCTNPMDYLNSSDGVRVAIPYSTSMGSHAVGSGLMAGDRVAFLEAIDGVLSGTMERAACWRRSRFADKPVNFQYRPGMPAKLSREERRRRAEEERKKTHAEITRRRRAALQAVLSKGTFTTHVLWQDPATRSALVKALCDVLGLEPPDSDNGTLRWTTPEIEVVLETRRSGGLCGGLDIGIARPQRAEVTRAVTARAKEAEDAFKGSDVDAAVIEIDREFKVPHRDPKFVIRTGAAEAGTLTQFIQSAEVGTRLAKDRPHRAGQAWLDVLRQAGAARPPLPAVPIALGSEPEFVAVWAINRQRRSATSPRLWRPIAVKYRPSSMDAFEGWRDDIRRWVPYRDFLLWLAREAEAPPPDDGETEIDASAQWSHDHRWRETMAFLRPLLYAQRGRPTVLMVQAQNLRSHWPWIGNARLIPDRIDVGDGDVPISLWGDELRVVRVRDSTRDETPQYYGSGGKHGLPAGLWGEPLDADGRLHYSSGERSVTGSNAAVGARKEGIRVTTEGREIIDTGTQAYNPNLVELCVVACTPNDVPAELASCVHQLRYAPELDTWLTLPYPLHQARKAAEYATPDLPPQPLN
ncbi:pPIWI_RE module domain-containing protein [Actinomadura rubrisoli]|uniref:DUF3893 domain-containing protein n=1 Tax=Actinomadura rubrisoli TaxID=2530368 RepID=A0A4R5BHC6_9ACTN|nr:DUF3962 domain-containing protein [Actinomadura rubrisoli]TDD84859.1 DUF3893 domain-containing protein [Actinomadura rubrisoli]